MSTSVKDSDLFSRNKDLADILNLIANYYKIDIDTFRARAFFNASSKIAKHPNAILTGKQAREELSGIGESIETAIDEFIETGTIERLEDLEEKYKDKKEIIDYFLSFYGIGPVTAIKFFNKGYKTVDDIWDSGELTEAQKTGIIWSQHIKHQIERAEMEKIRDKIGELLNPYGITWEITGSFRRGESTSGDIDLLIVEQPDLNMDGVVVLLSSIMPARLAQGNTKFMGVVKLDDDHLGHRIDIRLVPKESWAYALMYFTGSQKFNILIRQRAIEKGLSLNEYGLYNKNKNNISSEKEEDIFKALELKYIPPNERTRDIDVL